MNYQKYKEIKQLMGEDFKKLLAVYISDNKKRLVDLEEMIHKRDYREIKLISHSMKSSSANIGADQASNLAASIEQYAISESIANIQDLLPQLKKAFDEVIQILNNEENH